MIKTLLALTFGLIFIGCGSGFENDPRDPYPKTKTYVAPFDRGEEVVQFYLPEDGVGIESQKVFLFPEDQVSQFVIKAWVKFSPADYSLTSDNLPEWLSLEASSKNKEHWILKGKAPLKTNSEEPIEFILKITPSSTASVRVVNFMKYYQLESKVAVQITSLANEDQ